MESCEALLAVAAGELDCILGKAADLYLRNTGGTSAAPRIRAALGYTSRSEGDAHITCLADTERGPAAGGQSVDFPVLVSKGVVAAARTLFVQHYQERSETLAATSQQSCVRARDSLSETPHVTVDLLESMHPTLVAVVWVGAPQIDIFATHRRRWLSQTCFAHCDSTTSSDELHQALKEFVLIDLFLSVGPKLKSLWEYRLWLCDRMHAAGMLSFSLSRQEAAQMQITDFVAQDDELFFAAAHNHPMNYNAWHYRRLRFCLLHDSGANSAAKLIGACAAAAAECERVMEFIRNHNGDSSATAYLLFLLEQQEALDSKRSVLLTHDERPAGSCNQNSYCALAPDLWRSMLALTQTEVRRHAEKGHECIWHLRLGLVTWACKQPADTPIAFGWRVEDELRWVSAFVDAEAAISGDTLLSPVPVLRQAWTESSGSEAWTSYNAARYGIQLSTLLGCSKPRKEY